MATLKIKLDVKRYGCGVDIESATAATLSLWQFQCHHVQSDIRIVGSESWV